MSLDALGPATRRSLRGSLPGQPLDISANGQLEQDLTALWLLTCAFLVFFMQASPAEHIADARRLFFSFEFALLIDTRYVISAEWICVIRGWNSQNKECSKYFTEKRY